MSNIKSILFCIAMCLALALTAPAQSFYTPQKGSRERTAIMDVLRAPVEKDLKQKIVFVTEDLRVSGDWAFISGRPQRPEGGRPNYRHTRYSDAVDAGAFDNNFFALFSKRNGTWRIVTYAIGCTDVCYLDWPQKFKAPKIIFPHAK